MVYKQGMEGKDTDPEEEENFTISDDEEDK